MENKNAEAVGFLDGIGTVIKSGVAKRREDKSSLIFDAIALIVAFIFARCHIVFGAYPLGVSFVAVLPHGVWLALLGAVGGALSLGRVGVIHAIIAIIVVFMRIIISGGKNSSGTLFAEPLVLRISAAAIAAFVGAAYEVLLGGFAFTSILYGACSVLLSSVFTFAFSGIFESGISLSDFIAGKPSVLNHTSGDREKFSVYLFQATFLLFIFLISIALKGYNILGVTPAYIFSAFITMLVARRFGAVRAMAVGFVSSLGISGLYSVAFALVGLASGVLFSLGIAYGFIGAGVLLSAWSIYTGGTIGFLSTFPEYVIAALLCAPLLRKIPIADEEKADVAKGGEAADMVAATALAYRSSQNIGIDTISDSLRAVASALRNLGEEDSKPSPTDYRDMAIDCVKDFCRDCHFYGACTHENPAPCIENIDVIATKLYKKERLFADDVQITPKYCHNAASLFSYLASRAANLEEERRKRRRVEAIAEEYELIARLIGEVRSQVDKERCVNAVLSERMGEIFEKAGICDGAAKVFGERRKYFIGAGEDKDGRLITSPELHRAIEECAGVKLGTPDYYRKGEIALFECASAPMYSAEFATVGIHSGGESISGDTAISFESRDGHFYALVADGMGSGESAHRTSLFAADFLSRIFETPCTKSTAFHILNHIIKSRNEECSSTVDLFDFDLITGEALFFKCGAAPSYVKRGSSIFRIRSETAPLGLMKSIDAERIRVEVKSGDFVIMLSDGVSQSSEDSAWLLELLADDAPTDVREYAERILAAAERHSKSLDDMSVAVARVVKI